MNQYVSSSWMYDTLDEQAMSLDEWLDFSAEDYDEYYFHYTSAEIAYQIICDGILKPTWSRVKHFGYGIFFTELDPSQSDEDLLGNNYRGNYKYLDRLEYAIAIPQDEIQVIQIWDNLNRNIFRCDYEIDLNSVDFQLIGREMDWI